MTTTEEGSDDWIDLNKSIFDCQKAIIDAQKSLAKYSKTLDGIDWEKYQSIYDASSNVIDNYKETIQAQIDVAEAGGAEYVLAREIRLKPEEKKLAKHTMKR